MADLNVLLVCFDQLALARQQLENREAECGRLAHILTDNAVELMLHHQAECVAKSYGFPLSRRVEKEEQRELLGQHLDPKLKLARELGVLTVDQSEFITINHHYRNEVYHRGLRHNRVIWDLAWQYHSFACELLPRLKAGLGLSSHPQKPVPTRLLHYGKTQGEVTKTSKIVEKIAADVAAKSVVPEKRLGFVLGKAVEAEVSRLDKMLDWMVENHPKSRPRTRLELIIENQLWAALFEPARRAKCQRHPNATATREKMKADGTDPFVWMKELLIPPITTDPIQSWTRRAQSIVGEKNPITAVKKYHSLRLVMDELLEDTNAAAGALDNYHDQLRGK